MGATINKTTLVIYGKNSRGLHAAVDLKPNETVASVPLSLAITADTVAESSLGQKIIASGMLNKLWQAFVFTTILVLKEKHRRSTTYRPWTETLPDDASDYPGLFNAGERTWLQGSNTLVAVHRESLLLLKVYNLIVALSPDFGRAYHFEEFLSCYYLVVSRQFNLPIGATKKVCIVPYADMANTVPKGQENTDWEYDCKSNCLLLKARAHISKGTPVIGL